MTTPAPTPEPVDALARTLRREYNDRVSDARDGVVTMTAVCRARGRWAAVHTLQRGDNPYDVVAKHTRHLAQPDLPADDLAHALGALDGARQWLAVVRCNWCSEHATHLLTTADRDARPDLACRAHTADWTGNTSLVLLAQVLPDLGQEGST